MNGKKNGWFCNSCHCQKITRSLTLAFRVSRTRAVSTKVFHSGVFFFLLSLSLPTSALTNDYETLVAFPSTCLGKLQRALCVSASFNFITQSEWVSEWMKIRNAAAQEDEWNEKEVIRNLWNVMVWGQSNFCVSFEDSTESSRVNTKIAAHTKEMGKDNGQIASNLVSWCENFIHTRCDDRKNIYMRRISLEKNLCDDLKCLSSSEMIFSLKHTHTDIEKKNLLVSLYYKLHYIF